MKSLKSLAAAAICTVLFITTAYSANPQIFADNISKAAITQIPGTVKNEQNLNGSFLSVSGFAKGKITNRSNYSEGMSEYAVVTTPYEFFDAIDKASKNKVKVIELRNDLNLGWLELDEKTKEDFGKYIEPYLGSLTPNATPVSNPILIESGISCVTLSGIDGLTIFSSNGSYIRHSEIKLNSSVSDVAIRNINFDEVWEWDDWRKNGFGSFGGRGNHKRTGWSYIKLNGCKNVWLDHCSFGISFDGNVDIENGANGITISWCTFGDTNYSTGSMIERTATYLEELYKTSKTDPSKSSFVIYGIMRDNGMTKEQIMQYMAYHSKCHLVGAGDKDTWYKKVMDENSNPIYDENTGLIKRTADTSKTDANEMLRLTLAYNHYTNMGQRVPMIRGGVGHLYNCYIDDYEFAQIAELINSDPANKGKTIRQQIEEAGGTVVLLTRGMDARCEASIAADTCVYYGSFEPIVGSEFQNDDKTYLNSEYFDFFGYNHALIVNSSVQKLNETTSYTGSSWDNNGDNPFVSPNYIWHDKSTIGNWSWGNEGDSLSYEYNTFPLKDVVYNTTTYSGSGNISMSNSDWLKTDYSPDFKITPSNWYLDETTGEKHPITVSLEAITLNKTSAVIYKDYDEYLQLDEQVYPSNANINENNLKWSSSNPNVATVTQNGLVIPKSFGNTTITLEASSSIKAVCEVTVAKSVNSIDISVPENIYVGDEFYIKPVSTPIDALNQNFSISTRGTHIEILDAASGLAKAISVGSDSVLIKCDNYGNRITGKYITASKSISVKEKSSFISGDANNDGKVNLTDAKITLKVSLGILSENELSFEAADTDKDLKITLKDARAILKIALGI